MFFLSTPETTEVMYGVDNIIEKTSKASQELKYYGLLLGSSGPSAIIATEPIRKALQELIKRGITTRYPTDINKDK
jgi:hypothetical protein